MSCFVGIRTVLALLFLVFLRNSVFAYGEFDNQNQNIIANNIQVIAKENFKIVKDAIVSYEMGEDENEEHCDIGGSCFLKNLADGLVGNIKLTEFKSLLVPYEEIYGNFFKKAIYKLFGLNEFYNRFFFVFGNIRYNVIYKKAKSICHRYDGSIGHVGIDKIVAIYGNNNGESAFCDSEHDRCLFMGTMENGRLNFYYKLQP